MVFVYHVRPEYLKSPDRVTEHCEKMSFSLWKTIFPVEAVFPIEIILNYHVLNTYVVVDHGEATYLKAREHLGMICSFCLLL